MISVANTIPAPKHGIIMFLYSSTQTAMQSCAELTFTVIDLVARIKVMNIVASL